MDYLLISLTMAVAPGVVLFWYYNSKDKYRKEPARLLWKTALGGVFITVPAIIVERILGPFSSQFPRPLNLAFTAFIVAALTEEALKLWAVRLVAYNHKAFDEVTDGIIYCVVASLGFAVLENVLYVLNLGLLVALLRAFTSVPGHVIFSGVMGFYVGLARFAPDQGTARRYMNQGLGYAVLLHGLYDFFIFLNPVVGLVLNALLLIWGFLRLRLLIKTAHRLDLDSGRVQGVVVLGESLR
ncbi:MAG: PrsW family intramembrane metalloprotease [Deinococcus sp.]|nr:PrsW family intramembrane metalloprotease [Deinococcus sp.]